MTLRASECVAAVDEGAGVADLRPSSQALPDGDLRRLMIGRAQVLERLGLAEQAGPAQWTLRSDAEATLRAMADRGDIIRTMHRALARSDREPDAGTFAIHGDSQPSVLGRLADRGLQDESKGLAYVVIEGIDGRAHHVRFNSLEATGDASVGAVVEVRPFTGDDGQRRISLAVRSDLSLEAQVKSPGATWLDRTLLARDARGDHSRPGRVRRGRARRLGEAGGPPRDGRARASARAAHGIRARSTR